MKNHYVKKKVSAKDRKACLICGKPTVTVLFNKTGPDWFYTCDIHLVDNPLLVQPAYPKEYSDLQASLKTLKSRIEEFQRKQRGSWDVWINKFLTSSKSQSNDKSKEDSEDRKDLPENDPPAKIEPTLDALLKEYKETQDKLARIKESCTAYTLNDFVYQSRVDRLRKMAKAKEQKRIQEQSYTNTDPATLLQSVAFPEVPKNSVAK